MSSGLLDHWTLEYRLASDTTWSLLHESVSPVENAILAAFDPTMMLNGIYELKLSLYETNGAITSIKSPSFVVEGSLKIGNFTMSFTDLSVPVAGVPLEVVRSYDSRVKTKGDFGIGWTLDIKNMRVEESCVQGESWNCFINPIIYSQGLLKIRPLRSHLVSITIPGGKMYRFEAMPNPSYNIASMEANFDISYTQLGGKGASLRPLDVTGNVIVQGVIPGNFRFVDSSLFTSYDPNLYELTTQDGTKYVISQATGLQNMTDLNGNKLTIDNNGLHYTRGATTIKEILINRDPNNDNRITSVTDPAGKSITYSYGPEGDLVSVTDRENNETKFGYSTDHKHNLIDIDDPRPGALKPIRNEYDTDGRILSHTDANDNVIVYNHNLATGVEEVTNRLNKATQYKYDNRGNVTEVKDALNNITTYTYDEYDNKTSETPPGGSASTYKYEDLDPGFGFAVITKDMHLVTEQTDALSHKTVYKYDENWRILKTIDPKGYETRNYYSPQGNLMWTLDAKYRYTHYNYDTSGNMVSMTDAEDCVTSYVYDGNGYMTSQTQNGITTEYEYDANGNRILETKPAPDSVGGDVKTKFEYDDNGRLITTKYAYQTALETQSSTTYDSLGKPVVRTDTQGRETLTTYDNMGRVEMVVHPDESSEVNHYDDEGRLTGVESYDKAQLLKANTYHTYDFIGRKTRTDLPDGGHTSTVYDSQGRVTSETGEDNITTSYTYYANGNRQSMTRGVYTASYSYDANGNQTDVTDPDGTTHTWYDELNRATQTDYANGTHRYYQYDKLGRKTQDKDEADELTDYNYDCFGRISGVTQHIAGRMLDTSYGYDSAGNQISQTDAKTNQTTYEHDIMSRRNAKVLPNGLRETYNYERYSGRMENRVDFNGVQTDYTYDAATDLLTQEDAHGKITTNTYDNSNRRAGVNITEGGKTANMSFTYDVRDQLLTKTFTLDGLSTTLGYTRVSGGKLDVITTNHGYTSDYNYSPTNGLLSSRTDNGQTIEYTYTPGLNLDMQTLPNGVTVDYDYNTVKKLTKITVKKGPATLAEYTYTLGPTGNKTGVTETTGRTATWIYDDLYRLTNEQIASTPATGSVGYVYDDTGNREQRTSNITPIPTQVFTYDINDRVTTYTWDNNGNVLNDGRFSYTWNAKNELKRVQGTGVDVEYFYDADGLRIYRKDNVSGITTYYIWDSENPTGYPQVVEEIENNQVVRRYGYGLFLETIDIKNGTEFERFYVIRDGTNSVRMLLDSTGNVSAQYDYDAFGNLLSVTNANTLTVGNPYQFHSEYRDTATGLIYLRARWYDVNYGRFINSDSYEGSLESPLSQNKYSAFYNNGINNMDTNGNFLDAGSIMTVSMMTGILSIMPTVLWANSLDTNKYSWMVYTGTELLWCQQNMSGETEVKMTFVASSGWPGMQSTSESYQRKKLGPIPETQGLNQKYSINLTYKPDRIAGVIPNGPEEGELYAAYGIQEIRPKVKVRNTTYTYQEWGSIRARLEPQNVSTYGRDNFYLHDSGKGYSHGCVDVVGREVFDSYIIPYRKNHQSVDLLVNYSGSVSGPHPPRGQ